MAIDSFDDLLRELEGHPEWRERLRSVVLTDRLVSLPDSVDRLVEAQTRTEARVEELAQAQTRTEARVEQLATHVASLAVQVDALTQQMSKVVTRLDKLDPLHGDLIERRYREYASSYFAPIAKRIRVLTRVELDDLLDDAVDDGRLDVELAREIRWADTVARGRRDGQQVHLVVEASVGVGVTDVERADQRARSLAQVTGGEVLAIVAGERIVPEAAALAARRGVWQVTDGVVVQPPTAA